MKKIITLAAVCVVLTSGCANGSHILIGKHRQPIKRNQVALYQTPPAHYESVGIVNANSPGTIEADMNAAVNVLKEEAAEMGANGIILQNVNGGGQGLGFASSGETAGFVHGIRLSGEAIYVEPTP